MVKASHTGAFRLAVDTGGTFTDLVVGEPGGTIRMHKAPTTPDDPIRGVIDVLRTAAEAEGQALGDWLGRAELLVHGTTHAINAIVTGRTARTAFLTTAGHPDTLVFREGGRQDSFNFTIPYPAPYVPKALTRELPERILADGSVHRPLDAEAVVAVLRELAERKVEAVAVCLLWSIVNPAHEIEVGRLIEEHLPGVPYTLSHRINPSIREYRRAMSTCLDASLKPIMGRYMRGLDARLRGEGFCGRLLVVTSQGGVMEAAEVAESPVHLINSGPSLAPVGAQRHCAGAGTDTLIVGDTGGTTFDVSLVRDGRIPRTRETWLGRPLVSHMTGMPSVDIKSIGAGGGSIAWVDEGGLLHVGPQSAGADPGPVCYGRGGTQPTVTDASLVLGHIDPANFLGGRMTVDLAAAQDAIRRDIAGPLGCGVEAAAAAILDLATEHMVQAILEITVNQGLDPARAAFVAGGGAAGLNCTTIGRRLGCPWVLVPETGAALAASGALVSDLVAHFQAMRHTRSDAFDFDAAAHTMAGLTERALAFHRSAGSDARLVGIDRTVEARYPDQAWEIEIPLRGERLATAQDVADLVSDFHRTHHEIFAVSDPDSPIEIIGWSASARCRIGDPSVGRLHQAPGAAKDTTRPVYFRDGGWTEARIADLSAMRPDAPVPGPAILASAFTSVVVDPGAVARLDGTGMLVITFPEERPA